MNKKSEKLSKNLRLLNGLNFGIVLLLLPHLFCCILPVVLTIIGLVAPFDDVSLHFIPHNWMPMFLVFSGIMLIVSAALLLHKCPCCECDNCAANMQSKEHKKHGVQKIILLVVTVLYLFSLLSHFYGH